MTNALQQMKHSSIKTFSSHFIAGTRGEMDGMGEVEEERDEAEEEKRVGEGVMEVMEEEEGKGKKGSADTLLSPPPFFSPLYLFSPPPFTPLLPSPSAPFSLSFIYFMEILFPHTEIDTKTKKQKL